MKVELLSYTPDALNLLLRTKNTRLAFESDPAGWTEEKRTEHLEYMLDTIRSSWEFVDYTFLLSGVTRAFTQQLTRTRSGSYAQESQRTVDVREHEVRCPGGMTEHQTVMWHYAVATSLKAYADLIDSGMAVQDARGVLPINITTSIEAKFNLRTLSDMAKVRLCTRTQGEYQDVFRAMRMEVLKVHPWANEFLQVQCVATGTCAFPRYGKKDCPVYLPSMDNEKVRNAAATLFWLQRHESRPVAKEGQT